MRWLCVVGIHRPNHVVEMRKVVWQTEFTQTYYDESYAVCECGKVLGHKYASDSSLPLVCYNVTK